MQREPRAMKETETAWMDTYTMIIDAEHRNRHET